ncbi:P-loop containing nucleoside triphosphate hydrolase protein [Cristinia sonorae]|uniref:DNA helicase n=1 Tax=Cristinia sonorae TaxID=1940300 RepID=A0A8K0XRE9_9AGAR|nr:P-loop containing nucleoside triphosphate hydrolase protein [Cristinia sonorae]
MSSDAHLRAFFDRQRALLQREREEELARYALILSNSSQKLLEQKGLALGNLNVANVSVGLGGRTLVELERSSAYHASPIFPPHMFRPGDIARIEENSTALVKKRPSKSGDGAKESRENEGVVYKTTDTRIVIALDTSDSGGDDTELPERCRLVKMANTITLDRMDETIDQLERAMLPIQDSTASTKFTPTVTPLMRVLMGLSEVSDATPIKELTFFDDTLNSSQKEAVRFALEAPEVACIHGPPGTGKTHTLIEIIRQLTAVTPANPKPLRLLICGASNLSVDNILERLLALSASSKGDKLKFTRIGHPARVMATEGVLDATLEAKSYRSDQAALARDVKNELDTALNTLSGKGKGMKGKRPKGSERKKLWEEVRALRKEYRQREGKVVQSVLSESQIVLATCHSAGGRQLRKQSFDVAIIDEATQAFEAVCWIPILKAKKLIIAGDPKQLPPTVLSAPKREKRASLLTLKVPQPAKAETITEDLDEPHISGSDTDDADMQTADPIFEETVDVDDEAPVNVKKDTAAASDGKKATVSKLVPLRPPRSLETTLFDRLLTMHGSRVKRMLTVQYRMHKRIVTFPSRKMYNSRLRSHASVSSRLLRDLPNIPEDAEDDEDVLKTPVVFFDTAGCEYFERTEGDSDEGSKCNENEVTVVKNWVDKLITAGVLPAQIAVITPYQAQVTLLTSLLRPIYGLEIEIGTVDSMQGREKDAVIISLVRSNDKRSVGFLKDKRRLNVAMTRAKRHLCVIGDSSTVQHGSGYLKSWMTWLENNADVRYAGLD